MASKILVKRSSVANKTPLTSDLDLGELGINTNDGKIYIKKNDGSEQIIEASGLQTLYLNADFSDIKNNMLYLAETAGAALSSGSVNFTITLPASPKDNEIIRIVDGSGNAQNRPILVSANGNNIDGTADDLTCDTNYFDIKLVYHSATTNWILGGK